MKEVIPVYIEDEMRCSYLDYAMSVIVSRALPDVRDGLKPVHRRILYAMWERGLTHSKPFKKSATVVGEVLGKYHPHGDMAVYDTLVRMVQPFSLRYPLIEGQGNFGSIDGDAAAAYRYTEARLVKIAELMLKDIEKETVTWMPNFDGRLKEPTVLPSEFPNLLVNGASGIAVGMATNIPPHNLGEVVDALCALIKNPDLDDFSEYIKGPDFPTGGLIVGKKGFEEAYRTGRGKIILKAKVHTEKLKGNRKVIYITEIPYQVNKSLLIEQIADLVKTKKIDDISDIRDESDKKGIRIVLELKREAQVPIILNKLFKYTQLRTTYGINLLALKDGIPKCLTLKEFLESFLNHRYLVAKKRTEYELKQAEKHAHILEGLKLALSHIDEVIKIIRTAKTEKEAKENLVNTFKFTVVQAQAILDMKLSRLVGLEREKLDQDYLDTIKLIEKLKAILATRESIMEVLQNELLELKEKFNDLRRTKIVEQEERDLKIEDLIPNEPTLITFSEKSYIKRSHPDFYHRQLRGGVGVSGIALTPEDIVSRIFKAETHENIFFFTNKGRCYKLKAYEIPETDRSSRGKVLANLLPLKENEKVEVCLPVKELKGFVFLATKKGLIKKLDLSELKNIRKTGIIAISLKPNDSIVSATLSYSKDYVLLITRFGKVIRFLFSRVRPTHRTSQGVKGITLRSGDRVIYSKSFSDKTLSLFLITLAGYGKRVPLSSFRITNRGGVGIIGSKKEIADCEIVDDESEIIIITQNGQTLRTKAQSVRKMGRTARGVKLVNLRKGDKVAGIQRI
ncbi:DNA gyrase subunit A [candidate division WOR-3 bacterium]|nr:DNA gyrase subunit A [candidate division WOR-3 bacterium]